MIKKLISCSTKPLRSATCLFALLAGTASSPLVAADYQGTPAVKAFAQRMASEHGFNAAEVEAILSGAKKQQAILDAIARPAEKSKPWFEYRNIFLDERRINDGVAFWAEHRETLERAEKTYGVAPEVIVAIIGVETRYGTVTGNYRVLDALATLGFDYPPRASFFSRELEQFLLLAKEQKQDVNLLKGSYAGAMGYGQFMPSSYRAYAADFDGDGIADIWKNPVDAIGSVANYFKVHGWTAGQTVMVPATAEQQHDASMLNKITRPKATLKDIKAAGYTAEATGLSANDKVMPLVFEGHKGSEYWLGSNNFYVITRYNRSPMYARAVWELSNAIKERQQAAAEAKAKSV